MKVLWVSDDPRYSFVGQSRVTREFVRRMGTWSDARVAGFAPVQADLSDNALTVYPIHRRNRAELEAVWKYVFQPDVVVLSHDIFEFGYLPEFREASSARVIGYFTVDGSPIPSYWNRVLAYCDAIYTPSWWARDVLADAFPQRSAGVIPYGVDMQTYYPQDKLAAKRALEVEIRKASPHFGFSFEDACLYVAVGHNQGRKGTGVAVRAWPEFAKGKKAYFLAIYHIGKIPMAEFVSSETVDTIPLSRSGSALVVHDILPEDGLRLVYQAADYLVHPAMGEGFGLTLLEAMACGCVPIATDWSSHTDFCDDINSIPIKDYTLIQGPYGCDRSMVSAQALQERLEYSYRLWTDQQPVYEEKRAFGIATAQRYAWDASHAAMRRAVEAVAATPKVPLVTEL